MGRATRRRWAPLYLHGLLGPDGRKSLQPLAARLGLGGHDQLQHFIASPAWDDAPLRRVLAGEADALVGGPGAVLVVDDTALPKKGERSVGVARQYCGALGKRANCQALVSLTLARGEVPLPLGLRLFLPDEWTADPERCARAGVPEEHRRALAKPDLALAEIDRVIAAGVRFGRVLADAGYGASAAFRRGLSARPHLGGRDEGRAGVRAGTAGGGQRRPGHNGGSDGDRAGPVVVRVGADVDCPALRRVLEAVRGLPCRAGTRLPACPQPTVHQPDGALWMVSSD